MESEKCRIASNTKINESEWNELVNSLNGNLDLSLAARIFYITNTHSTHSFDYYVPDYFDYNNIHPEIAEYLDRARALVSDLKEAFPNAYEDEDSYWFTAAKLVGSLNLNDMTFNPLIDK